MNIFRIKKMLGFAAILIVGVFFTNVSSASAVTWSPAMPYEMGVQSGLVGSQTFSTEEGTVITCKSGTCGYMTLSYPDAPKKNKIKVEFLSKLHPQAPDNFKVELNALKDGKNEIGVINVKVGQFVPTPKDKPAATTTPPKEDLPPAFVPSKPEGYDGPLPDCAFDGTCRNVNDLLTLLVNWGQRIFGLIGSFALVMFIYGGFTMIFSAGNSEKVKKGRDILVAAVIGLTIAFSAYLLVDFILDALKVSDEFRGIKQ